MEENKKSSKAWLVVLLILILVGALCASGYYIYTLNEKVTALEGDLTKAAAVIREVNEKVQEQEENKVEENQKTELSKENTKKESNNTKINGKYKYEFKNKDYVQNTYLEVSNQTDSSIKFSIEASHGMDIDHVNIGQVSGTAKKITVPKESVVANSTQSAYQFVEDGNKITFVFTKNSKTEYVNIIEEYDDDINPYGGNGVYFAGKLVKVKKL